MTPRSATIAQRIRPLIGRASKAAAVRAQQWLDRAGNGQRISFDPPDTTDTTAMFVWRRSVTPISRPQYLWSVLAAAKEAHNLGIPRISAIECGVAGGNGLVALEAVAETAESLLGVGIDVYGFDSGTGMPEPQDPRDAPFVIQGGIFNMDVPALEARLGRARLVLGPVEKTVPRWLAEEHPPIGFVAFDLDYYSSTVHALGLLDGDPSRVLPRVVCYLDDIFGFGWSDFNGERAAIAEFNQMHAHRKVGPIHGLKYELPRSEFEQAWPEKIYLAHIFDHERYTTFEGPAAARWYEELRLAPKDPPATT
jgi:hypothetical protein